MTNILGWRLTTVIGEYFAQAMPILRFMGGSDVKNNDVLEAFTVDPQLTS